MTPNFINQYHPRPAIPPKQIIKSCLCGIQDYAVMMEQGKEKEETIRFAVRFPFWAVRRFLTLDMSALYNQVLDLELLIPGCNSKFEELFYCHSFEERIIWMETYLLGIFNPEGYNPNLFNSIEYLLRSRGRAPVRDICGYSTVSQRQLERLFKQEIGISIKRTTSQAHLLNEFKRFHGLWPSQAKLEALERR